MKQELFGWGMTTNLQWIVLFHNECDKLRGNRIFEIKQELRSCNDKDRKFQLMYEKGFYEKTYYRMLLVNTFLMMYSFLEEFIYLVSKMFPDASIVILKTGSVTRFKNVFKKSLEMDLAKSDWKFIVDCEEIRDCLLHANGRIDLSRNKSKIREIISSRQGLLESDNERLILKRAFIVKVNRVLNSFIEKIKSKK